MQVTMKRRSFLLSSSSTLLLAPTLASAASTASAGPNAGSGPVLSAPQRNDYSGIFTLKGEARDGELLWQAGQAPFDQVALRLEKPPGAALLTLEKHALASGTVRVQARIGHRSAGKRIAFRLSSITGLQLYVDGVLIDQATTPAAKADLSLTQGALQGSHVKGAQRVLLINERIV